MEKVALLGATGSVGKSVLDVIRHYPGRFRLSAVSGFRNLKRLGEIIDEFSPTYVAIGENQPDFEDRYPGIIFFHGEEGLIEIVTQPDIDTAVIAVSGIVGLKPTITAIEAGKRILTANKESLVAAGEIINTLLAKHKNEFIPLDSEHNSIFNQFIRVERQFIDSITLTASGGPFRDRDIDETVTVEDVLNHPTWDMGKEITVNSATMMNKGLEVIEAHHLFGLPYDQIKVLIHPQSVVHGIVTTIDGSQYLAASPSDMRYPISLAMFYPEIPSAKFPELSLVGKSLEFFEPDTDKFPLLALAYACGRAGGIMPTVLNAANEIFVEKFLNGFVYFALIPEFVARVIERFEKNIKLPSVEEILIADKQARIYALELMNQSLRKS